VFVAQLDEFGGVREAEGKGIHGARTGIGCHGVALAADEAPADRVIRLFEKHPARRVVRAKRHRVRVAGQACARGELDVGPGERHGYRAVDEERVAVGPVGPGAAHERGIDGLGLVALQPRDDGVGRAVADAGRTERSVQHARDASHRAESAARGRLEGDGAAREIAGRPQRTDRVGARGAYSDGEQLERRDVRTHPLSLRRGERLVPVCRARP
jgi:hypothetical protein